MSNKPDFKKYLSHFRIELIFFLLVIFSSLLYSCEKDSDLGVDLIEDEPVQVYYIDTPTVVMSTVILDSLITSTNTRLLMGYHSDSAMGKINAKVFFMPSIDSVGTYPDEDYATYDSTTMLLYYDDYSFYDTMTWVNYRLFQLEEEMEKEDNGYLYNTSTFPYDNTPDSALSQITFRPRPHRESVEMTVNESFGRKLFQQIMDKDEIITNSNKFNENYKGFVLEADQTDGPILGFTTRSRIIIYYTESGDSKTIEIPIGSTGLYSNSITSDRSNSLLANLLEQRQDINSSLTNHQGYIQGGTGIGIRLEFPYLHKIREITKNTVVSEAYLQLKPVKGSYDNIKPLTSSLAVQVVNPLNRITSTLSTTTNLYMDLEYKENTYYSISIKDFVQEQMQYTEYQGDGIMIILPDSLQANSLNRLYIGDSENASSSALQLVVLTIDPKPL